MLYNITVALNIAGALISAAGKRSGGAVTSTLAFSSPSELVFPKVLLVFPSKLLFTSCVMDLIFLKRDVFLQSGSCFRSVSWSSSGSSDSDSERYGMDSAFTLLGLVFTNVCRQTCSVFTINGGIRC